MKNKEIFVDHGKSNQIAVGWGMWEVRKWRKSGGNILKPRGWGEEGRQRAIAVRHYDCQTGFFFFFLIALNFSLFSEPAIIFNKSVALQMFFPLLVMPSLLFRQLESFHLFKAKLKFHPPWCFSRLLQAESILLIPMLHNMTLTPFDELACWIIKLCMSFFFIAAWATRRHELCLVFSTRLLSTHSISVSFVSWILKYKQGCPCVAHSIVGGTVKEKIINLKTVWSCFYWSIYGLIW